MEVHQIGGAGMDQQELIANLAANIVGNVLTDQEENVLLRRLCAAVENCLQRLDRIERKIDELTKN